MLLELRVVQQHSEFGDSRHKPEVIGCFCHLIVVDSMFNKHTFFAIGLFIPEFNIHDFIITRQ